MMEITRTHSQNVTVLRWFFPTSVLVTSFNRRVSSAFVSLNLLLVGRRGYKQDVTWHRKCNYFLAAYEDDHSAKQHNIETDTEIDSV